MKTIKKLAFLFSFVFLTFVTSCSWGHKDNFLPPQPVVENGQVLLSLSLGGVVSSARMVEAPEWDFSKYTFSLEGENSEGKTVAKEFIYNEISSLKIYVYFGTWNFTLSAYNTSDKSKKTVITGSLSDFTVNNETTKLSFVMNFAEGENAAKGSIVYSVKYPSNEYTALTVYVHNKPTGYITDVLITDPVYAYYFSKTEELQEYFNVPYGVQKKTFLIESEEGIATANVTLSDFLEGGNYTLYMVVESYTIDPNTHELIGPLSTSKYEAKVPVIPGEVTNGSYEFTDINRRYTILYDLDETLEADPSDFPSTFAKYCRKYIPAVESDSFDGWYYTEGTRVVELPLVEEGDHEGEYILNADYSLTHDVELVAKVLKGNIETNIFDPSTISINGPEVLEYENENVKYSTVDLPGASYVWYWDGIEVENDQTCDINITKLDLNSAGYHTLKVEIYNDGVYADSSKEVFVGPYFIPYFNSSDYYNEAWKLAPINDEDRIYHGGLESYHEDGGYPEDYSIDLQGYCFDSDNNFYAAEYNKKFEKYTINKYSFNIYSGFSEGEVIKEFEGSAFGESNQEIKRMTTDGKFIYFISGADYPYLSFTPETGENLFRIEIDTGELTKLSISDDTVFTALSYENGYLYLAGFSQGDENEVTWTDRYGKEIKTSIYDYEYGIYKYPVDNGQINWGLSESIYIYSDSDLLGTDPLLKFAKEENETISGNLKVNNMITDLVVKNDCIYAVRLHGIKISEGYYKEDWNYSVLYKDKESFTFEIRNLEKRENSVSTSNNICPIKILYVRRKELDFGYSYDGGYTKIITLDLSDPNSILLSKTGEYGYKFDQATGSSFEADHHSFFAGKAEPESSD